MKKLIFCLQNNLIEEILYDKEILNDSSLIVRKKEELTYSLLEREKPDLIFFPHWSFKVPAKIFKNFQCICFHSTPLPYGRGGTPIQNMIMEGFDETEVCSLQMIEEFDAGPIYLRSKISLEGKLSEILERIYHAIGDQIKIFIQKDLVPIEQKGKPTIFNRIKYKDNSIKGNESLLEIFNKIRMLDSDIYPSTFVEINKLKMEFYDANLTEDSVEARVKIKLKS